MSLILKNLNVEINKKLILKNINFSIEPNDVVLILGPNGHGKSTLLKSIMKHYDTNIVSGELIINNKNANEWSTDQIAKEGIYLATQYPVEIPGLGMLELIRNEASKTDEKLSIMELYKLVNNKMKNLHMSPELLNRNINENFSGGERKKSEILQMQILNPQYILLDEIDSGLDVDAINVISEALLEEKNKGKAIAYISHDNKLFNTLKPNKTILIMNGEIVKVGDFSLAEQIYQMGYTNFAKQNNIKLESSEDDFLKGTNKGFACGSK